MRRCQYRRKKKKNLSLSDGKMGSHNSLVYAGRPSPGRAQKSHYMNFRLQPSTQSGMNCTKRRSVTREAGILPGSPSKRLSAASRTRLQKQEVGGGQREAAENPSSVRLDVTSPEGPWLTPQTERSHSTADPYGSNHTMCSLLFFKKGKSFK